MLALLVLAIGTGEFPISPGDGGRRAARRRRRRRRSSSCASCGCRARCARSLVGIALGISGAMFQSLTRNPLGSPDIVGFPQGASVGALIVITVIGGSGAAVSAGALAGGALTALAVYLLAFKRGGTSGYRLDPDRHRDRRADARDHRLPARARADRGGAGGDALAARLAQRPHVGRRRAAARRRSSCCACPRILRRAARCARSSSATTPPTRSGCAWSARGSALVALAVALVSVTTVAVGPIGFVALTAPQIARRLARTAGPPLVCSALIGRGARARRRHRGAAPRARHAAARRRHDRRVRRALPRLAADRRNGDPDAHDRAATPAARRGA